jgi:L-rhamnose mutarotase
VLTNQIKEPNMTQRFRRAIAMAAVAGLLASFAAGCDDAPVRPVAVATSSEESTSADAATAGTDHGGRHLCEMILLSPDKVKEYEALHKDIPKAALHALKEHHFHHYAVYLKEVKGQYYVVRSYDYSGKDLTADLRLLDVDHDFQHWRTAREACEIPASSERVGQWWTPMQELCHTQ